MNDLKALESLLRFDSNLLLWRSHRDSGRTRYFVHSSKLDGLGSGGKSLKEAVESFTKKHGKSLKRNSIKPLGLKLFL